MPAVTRPSDPYAPFIPQRGRRVALGFAAASLVVFAALTVALSSGDVPAWNTSDSVLLLGVGVLLAATMWRFAALRAVPSPTGLVVRNILLTREVTWAEVSRVRFAGGDPWVVLDLADGDQLAVMAVQKADGPFARAAAQRLAALVQAGHSGRLQ